MESNEVMQTEEASVTSSTVIQPQLSQGTQYSPAVTVLQIMLRILAICAAIFIFLPKLNPAKVSALVSKTQSYLTSGLSFSQLIQEFIRPVQKGWVQAGSLRLLYTASLGGWFGVLMIGVGAALSLGEIKLKRLGVTLCAGGALFSAGFTSLIFLVYRALTMSSNLEKVQPNLPAGIYVLLILNGIIALTAMSLLTILPKADKDDVYEMDAKYRLFLMMLPFLTLIFVFSYLPLWGWVVSFYDYKAGYELTPDRFVGLKWLRYLFQNEATRADVGRVLRNTLAMSGLGLSTSWMAMAFAIFLMEMRNIRYRRVIQTLTTIPNFISWVLVYTFALAIFSTEGFFNSILIDLKIIEDPQQWLQNSNHIWIKMLLWGMWKGLGWGAIVYIAAITGIDQQLFEAAMVDGAGRFRRIWHITVPSLMPTFFVLLLLGIANILSNGMEQYYLFKNAMNKDTIEVLDLYVYVIGIGSGGSSNVALATLVGLMKSVISVTLLFATNKISKMVRGESIV